MLFLLVARVLFAAIYLIRMKLKKGNRGSGEVVASRIGGSSFTFRRGRLFKWAWEYRRLVAPCSPIPAATTEGLRSIRRGFLRGIGAYAKIRDDQRSHSVE